MMEPVAARRTDAFLFVARAPVPGTAKTRLGATIGMERAAALYASFLVDLAGRFTPSPGEPLAYDFGWAYSPADVDFAGTLRTIGCAPPPPAVRFVPQVGDGLAARLTNLFRSSSASGYRRTVIVATDSPHLPRSVAEAGFAALDDHDVAIGRTIDGGYYLIGLRGWHDVLTGAPLSTGYEADALVARAGALGLRVAELPPSFDVDEESDLARLRDELAPDGATARATWRSLHELGLVGAGSMAVASAGVAAVPPPA